MTIKEFERLIVFMNEAYSDKNRIKRVHYSIHLYANRTGNLMEWPQNQYKSDSYLPIDTVFNCVDFIPFNHIQRILVSVEFFNRKSMIF